MAIKGTYIPNANTGSSRKDHIIDSMLSFRLERFRQLHVQDEHVNYGPNPLQSIWYPWLPDAPLKATRNGLKVGSDLAAGTLTVSDTNFGTFNLTPTLDRGETIVISYLFDYFPDSILGAFIDISIDVINAAEPGTNYSLNDMPQKWDGAVAEQAYIMAIEKLLLDDLLWRTRLIFADPDSVIGQLEAAMSGAKERLNDIILPALKKAPYVSAPTAIYYDAIRMGGGRSSAHGQFVGYGKTRGIRINRWFGR